MSTRVLPSTLALALGAALAALAALAGCDATGDECADGRCDKVGSCEVVDRSDKGVPTNLADPVAKKIFGSRTCPKTFREVMAAFKKAKCKTVETRIVETQAQHLAAGGLTGDRATDAMKFGGAVPELGGYHTVTSLDCGSSGKIEDRVLILQSKTYNGAPKKRDGSAIAVDPAGMWETNGLRKPMEAIAWDPTGGPVVDGQTTGVFNYYALEPSDERAAPCAAFGKCEKFEWNFFGDSADFLAVDAALKPDAKFPEKRRCAVCHTGGGLIMRELNSPWINWEEDFVTPGAAEVVRAHKELGTNLGSSSGANQEFSVVGQGNELWDGQRIKIATSPAVMPNPNPMLKPLFCTNEVNIQTAFSQQVSGIDSEFFLDPMLLASNGVNFSLNDGATYTNAVMDPERGQFVPHLTFGTDPDPTKNPAGVPPGVPRFGIRDAAGGFMVPERAGADVNYLQRLTDAGFLEANFVQAVLGVDFSRPMFSATRCATLAEAGLTWADVTAGGKVTGAAVTAGVKAKLEARRTAGTLSAGGAQLLANLADPNAMTAKVDAFAAACTARGTADEAAFMKDVLHIANVVREAAYAQPIVRLIPTGMPVGMALTKGAPTANARLDPDDCTLEMLPAGS